MSTSTAGTPMHMHKCSTNDDIVLQFLLGAAPLCSKASEPPRQAQLRVVADVADDERWDTPLLEYASDVASDDDYVVDDCIAATAVRTTTTCKLVCDPRGSSDIDDDQTADAHIERTATTAGASVAAATAETATAATTTGDCSIATTAAGPRMVKTPHDDTFSYCCRSETSSICTDSDDSLSDEVERETCELTNALHATAANDQPQAMQCRCTRDTHTRSTVTTDANGRLQRQRTRCNTTRTDRSPKTPHSTTAILTSDLTTQAPATRTESVVVGFVALAMLLYVAATLCAFVYPPVAELPSLATLQSPIDLANVSLAITSPTDQSIASLPLHVQFELRDFPLAALDAFGPEAFAVRIYVDDVLAVSEIGVLDVPPSVDTDSVGHIDTAATESTVTTTVHDALVTARGQHVVPHKHFPTFATYALRVEVLLPVPGSDGVVLTLEQRVRVTHAFDLSRKLALVAPQTGTVVAEGDSVLVRFVATMDVRRLQFVLDGDAVVIDKQRSSGDGDSGHDSSLLLRGLSVGAHSLALEGFDALGNRVASSGVDTIAIDVV